MIKYKIIFKYNIDNFIHYDKDEQSVDINEIDDECFRDMFKTKEQVKDFEKWYNEDYIENPVNIHDIIYGGMDSDSGEVDVIVYNELNNDDTFAKELIYYMFEMDWPVVDYHISGTTYEDYWNYTTDSPEQRTINVEYDKENSITKFTDVTINKIS